MRQRGSKGKQATPEKSEHGGEAGHASPADGDSSTPPSSGTDAQRQHSPSKPHNSATPFATRLNSREADAAFAKERKAIEASWPTSWKLWLIVLLFTGLGFGSRFWDIQEPNETVFDEVYFGSFTTSYVQREYFFDIHPPLGKLVLAWAG